ncbi:MAG: transcriptional regulator, partial [Proteobacteria bacterium]
MSQKERLLTDLIQTHSVLRARDLEQHGIARAYLKPLIERGILTRVGRGLYASVDAEPTEYQTLLEVMARVPQGVICLASALRFHN